MPMEKGRYLGGIRTVEDLRQRSYVDPDTGCWHWRLAMVQNAPKIHFQAPDTGAVVVCKGRRATLWLQRGHDVPAGHLAYRRYTCTADDCVNPAHATSGTPTQWGAERRKGVDPVAKAVRSRNSLKAWDQRGRLVTPAMVREIRTSTDSVAAVAQRLGISQFCVWSVRTGQTHKHVPPFVTVGTALMGQRLPRCAPALGTGGAE